MASNSQVFTIENGKFGLSLTDPGVTDPCAATISDFSPGDFTCRISSGALNASSNIGSDTVPATWCSPEQTIPTVGETSYSLDLSFLQDPNIVEGLSRYLFEHDTKLAYFFVGMDGDDPPKAIGQVRLSSGSIGGEGRTTLTADVSLPTNGKPAVCFGDATSSAAIGGLVITPTGATAGSPGSFTPAGATVPADLPALSVLGDLGQTTAWTTGQHVVLGDASHAHWAGTAWASGDAT